MDTRGQAALDLLLALVILLVVLASLGGILSSFTTTQKEISLHQQLGEQARLSAVFLSLHAQHFHENYSYPSRPGGPPSLVDVVNAHTRSTGTLSLTPVRVSGYAQGVPCSILANASAGTVDYTTLASEVGLPTSITYSASFPPRAGFDAVHSINSGGCGTPLVVEEN